MNWKTTLSWSLASLILTGTPIWLRADTTNKPPASVDRETLRQQLKNMTPEERRARIEALRKERGLRFTPGQPAERRFPQRDRLPRARMQRAPRQGDFALYRVLTEEQRRSLRGAMDAQREKTRELENQLRAARKAELQTTVAEKINLDTVRAKALEVGRLEAELAVLRAQALSQMKPPLSAEQIEKFKNPPPFTRGENRGDFRPPPNRRFPGPRDKNDLPLAPAPEK